MGWRDVIRKYGPAVLTALVEATAGPATPQAAPAPLEPANRVPLTNPPIEMPRPVAPPVDPLAQYRQFVIDTYQHAAPRGLNRPRGDISETEIIDGCEKVQKYGTNALLREMYGRNGVHDDQMPPELLVNNPA